MDETKENLLNVAIESARKAGELLLKNFGKDLEVNQYKSYDIKLQIDKDTQKLIEDNIKKHFPTHAILGEEGKDENNSSPYLWIIDPIDGTVNFFYNIPHYCISIAVRKNDDEQVGLIFDPNLNEMWTVKAGEQAKLNGKKIKPSNRKKLSESIITVGCSKTPEALETGLERFRQMSTKARKVRMMGSAALGMAYISCGRLDAYIEDTISIWDIAAGKMLIEAGGGKVIIKESQNTKSPLSIIATNGNLEFSGIPALANNVL